MKLYHFTKADIAIRKILPLMNLRMNYIGNMNDPKENLYHIVNESDYADYKGKNYGLTFDEYLIVEKIRNETRIIAFSTDRETLVENIVIEDYGYQFQRMWANYGQNHEGICLEIDYSNFINENERVIDKFGIIDKKIIYDRFKYQGIPRRLRGMSVENCKKTKPKSTTDFWNDLKCNDQFIENRFFTKSFDWKGEAEYRFLSFSTESDDIMLSIKNSLSKVIIGLNFSKYYIPSLKGIVPNEKLYTIEFKDIDADFGIRNLF